MSDTQAKLELSASGKDREKAVTAKFSDGPSKVIGRFDLTEPDARKRLVESMHREFPGLDPSDLAARVEELAVRVEAPDAAKADAQEQSSQASRIVELAENLYEVFVGNDGDVYAVPKSGPRIAAPLDGNVNSLQESLATTYYEKFGSIARAGSFGDALLVLAGKARKQPRRDVYLRAAAVPGGYEIDIGDETGRCIFVSPGRWEIREASSVHFYRTAITLPLAEPVPGGSLDNLWDVMNVSERDRPLVLAYAIGTFFPDRESPILMAVGAKGSGKSSIARAIVALCDPNVADIRTPPTQRDQWSVTASGSRVIALDNISSIEGWQSDAFCRATTGDAYVTREHYTNKGLAAIRTRVGVIITSIDAGAIKDDLGDRCVVVEAPLIDAKKRVQDQVMRKRLSDGRGPILGALLDLAARVLTVLPEVRADELPRIGDYFLLVLAVDEVLGTDGAGAFKAQARRIVNDVIESDPTSAAIIEFMADRAEWVGSSKDLMVALWPEKFPHGAPKSPRALSAVLHRMAPTLKGAGISTQPPGEFDRPRNWRITRCSKSSSPDSSSDRRTVGTEASNLPMGQEGPAEAGASGQETVEGPTIDEPRRSDGSDGLFDELPEGNQMNGWEEYL